MIKVALSGATGRMGRAILELMQSANDLQLVGALVNAKHPELGADVGASMGRIMGVRITDDPIKALAGAHVLIDFSHAEGTRAVLPVAASEYIACVVGTTGLDAASQKVLEDAAEKVPVVAAPNMSVGVAVLNHLVEQATKLLGNDYDTEIVEAHHRHKLDAPSGTALRLAETIQRAQKELGRSRNLIHGRHGKPLARTSEEIGMHAVRAGGIVGDHTVMFASEGERLELTHRAHTRAVFAEGALRAARWAAAQPAGLYGMREVLELE